MIDTKIENGQMEMSLKCNNPLNYENGNNSRNFKNGTNECESIPTSKKLTSVPLKSKNSNNEKLTRSSTVILSGNGNNSKQFSNQIIKVTNRTRSCGNTQPIWKPAGNSKVSFPTKLLSRQNTRSINANFEKKKEKLDGVSRLI